jgi:hypothetical protein
MTLFEVRVAVGHTDNGVMDTPQKAGLTETRPDLTAFTPARRVDFTSHHQPSYTTLTPHTYTHTHTHAHN